MQTETIFDKILTRQISAEIVFEDESVLAFRDNNPQAPVHVLVIPKKKVKAFADLPSRPDDEVGALFRGAARVAEKLALNGPGYRVVINNGRDAGQSVDYIHLHILSGRHLSWPPG